VDYIGPVPPQPRGDPPQGGRISMGGDLFHEVGDDYEGDSARTGLVREASFRPRLGTAPDLDVVSPRAAIGGGFDRDPLGAADDEACDDLNVLHETPARFA
jgi:hypothetical protein